MNFRISRHARRQMKWRKISEEEVVGLIKDPDSELTTIKGRANFIKILGKSLIKVTALRDNDGIIVITALRKEYR